MGHPVAYAFRIDLMNWDRCVVVLLSASSSWIEVVELRLHFFTMSRFWVILNKSSHPMKVNAMDFL